MANSITGLGSISTIFWTSPSMTNDITSSYISVAKFFQFTGTKTESTRIIDGIGQVIDCGFTFANKQAQFDFLEFFEGRKSSLHKFWNPVWTNTFELFQQAFTNDTKIYIKPCFFTQGFQEYERIWILLKDGSKIVRHITAATELADKEELTLDTALDRDISQDDIEIFGRFILGRFGANEVEFEYETTYYAQTKVKFYELVQEYEENDAEQNQFAELYKLEFPDITYYYTSFYKDIDLNDQIYEAVPMRRGRIESNINIFMNNKLEIVSRPTEALKTYIFNSTLLKVEVTITKLDIALATTSVKFRGTGGGIAMKDEFISMSLTPISSIFEFKIPTVLYQPFDNNVLFDEKNGLLKADWVVTTEVTEASDNRLQSSDFGLKADGWFTGGFVQYNNEYRLITNHVGNYITLQCMFNENMDN